MSSKKPVLGWRKGPTPRRSGRSTAVVRVSSGSHGNTGLSIFALPRTLLCVWSSAGTALRVSCHVCACPLAGAATWDRPGEVARLHCAVLPHSPILAAWRRVEPLQLGSPVNRYVAKDMPTHISTQGGFETLALEVRHHRLVGSRFPLDTVRRNHLSERPVRTLMRRIIKRSCEIHVRINVPIIACQPVSMQPEPFLERRCAWYQQLQQQQDQSHPV